MRRITRGKFFCVRHHEFYRPAGALREKIGNRKIDPVALAAEFTADVCDIDANAAFRQAECFGHLRANPERIFCRDPDLDFAVVF